MCKHCHNELCSQHGQYNKFMTGQNECVSFKDPIQDNTEDTTDDMITVIDFSQIFKGTFYVYQR